MMPGPDECLSFLMGGDAIRDDELTGIGITIVRGAGSPFRSLLVPSSRLEDYKALVRAKLSPGYWNEIVGRREVSFIFKLADGSLRELELSEATRPEIARLCSALNQDPIEKTSDMPRYLAGNPFYRELIQAFHAGADVDGAHPDS
jgi:hypothetical protein